MGRIQYIHRYVFFLGLCICLAFVPFKRTVVLFRMASAEDDFHAVVTQTDAPNVGADSVAETEVFRVEIIRDELTASSYADKKILIYHTHTYEAYEQVADAPYKQTEKWRTADARHNVVAVGKALTASLTALGFQVEHDTTAFEPPTLDDAYERSLSMLEQRRKQGEQYDLYIDLHRDAVAATSTIRRNVSINDENIARFMVLIGMGTTGGYTQKPDWEENLAIAQKITQSLNSQCSGLARDVKIKTGRFNQHIDKGCILIECGMNTNTLEEVLAGIPYLAQAIADTFSIPNE